MNCTIPGCTRPVHASGLCAHHYGQAYRAKQIPPRKEKPLSRKQQRALALKQCQHDLKRARECYKLACGHETRMMWRRAEMELMERQRELEAQ